MDPGELLLTAAIGVATSAATAYATAAIKLRQTRAEWDRDLTLRLAEASANNPAHAQALARQFAIAFVVLEVDGERSKIFLAPNTRVTAGRAPDNAIVLPSPASRHHFALVSDDASVFAEDLGSANGVMVNQVRVSGRQKLADFDDISVGGGVKMTFHYLKSA